MTGDEALDLASRCRASTALAGFAKLAEAERRRAAKPVLALWKAHWRARFSAAAKPPEAPKIRDEEALRVAMLATAVPSELKPYGWQTLPQTLDVVDVMRALRPGWLDRYVADLVDASAHLVWRVAPLWRAGLCARPAGDGVILGYYSHVGGARMAAEEPDFATQDIWRFFEVEGGGEISLAATDKYTSEDAQWSTVILRMCREGQLDRDRLLDASLDALERDFGQFRVGWYSRLHTALAPSTDEMAARAGRYLGLLASPIPPTVSFALKALKALDRAGRLEGAAVLAEIAPALQARQKSAASEALQLVAAAAKRDPALAPEAARLAATALISEAMDVQKRALDLVETLDAVRDPEVAAVLGAHLDAVAPSLRPRLEAMLGAGAPAVAAAEEAGEAAPTVALPAAAAPVAPAAPVSPVDGIDAAVGLFLQVLETCRDPLAVERAIDGLARFGAAALAAGTNLTPLTRRARQLLERDLASRTQAILAATGLAWVEGRLIEPVLASHVPGWKQGLLTGDSFAAVFQRRNDEVLSAVQRGAALPLLSLPSDTSGCVAPGDLVDRLAVHGGEAGSGEDLALALLRLGAEGREAARARLDPGDEAGQALAYALGAAASPGPTTALWVAAWAARAPMAANGPARGAADGVTGGETDGAVVRLVGRPVPDAGTPAAMTLETVRDGKDPY
ncbi:MAG: DUF6493 family protein, partial [Pseudomonadota bacterium]